MPFTQGHTAREQFKSRTVWLHCSVLPWLTSSYVITSEYIDQAVGLCQGQGDSGRRGGEDQEGTKLTNRCSIARSVGWMHIESLEVLEMKLILPLATSTCPDLPTG